MKNPAILILSLLVFSANSIFAQSSMLEKGFSLKFAFGFPPSEYGYDGDLPYINNTGLKTTFGLELGNQWYFYTSERFGIGLDVNWFDVVYGNAKFDLPVLGEVKRHTLDGSFLEFGPVATLAVNDFFAVEGYYNLRPSYLATLYSQNEDDKILIYDFGFLNGLGIGARIKFIYIGYEYTFGSIEGKTIGFGDYEDDPILEGTQPMSAKNSKLVIGFQF